MFHHLGWCRTFAVINTNEHVCWRMWWEGLHPVQFSSFITVLVIKTPTKHSLPISVLWKGAGPGMRVTLQGSVSWCGAGAGAAPGKFPPASWWERLCHRWGRAEPSITRPSLAETGSLLRLSALAESPCISWGGQDLLPRLGNYNQGLLYKGDCFFPLPSYLKWLSAGLLDTKP